MKLKLTFVGFDRKDEVVEVEAGKTYSDVLESLGINPETVVVVKEGTPIPNEARVEEGEVKVIRVISGG